MSPRPIVALALAAAGLAMTGCASIPGIQFTSPTPPVSPPVAPPASERPADPTGHQSDEPTASPSPSRTRPTTRSSASPRPTESTRPGTPRPSSSYNPAPDAEEIENGYVPRASIELRIQSAIREKTGKSAYVSCPGNLAAKVGEQMACDLKRFDNKAASGRVEVKVTAVENKRVRYSIQMKP